MTIDLQANCPWVGGGGEEGLDSFHWAGSYAGKIKHVNSFPARAVWSPMPQYGLGVQDGFICLWVKDSD